MERTSLSIENVFQLFAGFCWILATIFYVIYLVVGRKLERDLIQRLNKKSVITVPPPPNMERYNQIEIDTKDNSNLWWLMNILLEKNGTKSFQRKINYNHAHTQKSKSKKSKQCRKLCAQLFLKTSFALKEVLLNDTGLIICSYVTFLIQLKPRISNEIGFCIIHLMLTQLQLREAIKVCSVFCI